jgi:membrane protease YdiL (CAAX protease family)
MAQNRSQPWNPDRNWADPFIAALLLVIVLLAAGHSRSRRAGPHLVEDQASLQGRIQDVVLGATHSSALAPLRGWSLAGAAADPRIAAQRSGWDQAVLAVHAAERGDVAAGAGLIQAAPGAAGEAFRQAWAWCYQDAGSAPAPERFPAVRAALGGGYAARLLEARLLAKSGGDPRPLEAQAQAWAVARLAALGAAGLAGILFALAGLGFAVHLALRPLPPVPLPRYGLSGRAVLIVVLGWFLTLMAAGPMVAAVAGPLPWIKPIYLPLVYACHALAGTAYLLWAEGVDLATLWRRVAPDRFGAALASGLGFFALAFAAVLAVSLALSPFLPGGQSPQKELLEFLAHLRGAWSVGLLFLTVAVLAPAFEELMFRGFLLPWLGERLSSSLGAQRGRRLAVAVTGLSFGVMHMQPLGLPTLTTLGIVLGFAFLRTGNLTTSILVHGLWNGGVFILMRAFS